MKAIRRWLAARSERRLYGGYTVRERKAWREGYDVGRRNALDIDRHFRKARGAYARESSLRNAWCE